MLDERLSLLLIDRYSYYGLRPCSKIELASIGYKTGNNFADLSPLFTANINLTKHQTTSFSPDREGTENRQREKLASGTVVSRWPEPDLNRMIAFKPSRRAEFGSMQPIPGGGLFLFPSILADLIKRLPPPQCFHVKFYL